MPKWDADACNKFHLAMLHVLGAPVPDMNQVAALMGEGYTAEALRFVTIQIPGATERCVLIIPDRSRYYKTLKKEMTALFGEGAAETGAASTTKVAKKTPVRRGGGAKTMGKMVGSKRKADEKLESEEDDEGEDKSPTKKLKTKVKEEVDESDGDLV
ncbi:hypothetical protein PRZ48_007622 [Zasmidium cellare]|uniref:Uncharacterized protein n=1 Tax=Zasmidium cellare TaxID=395010 RepID=A0ABR0EKR5_ZASCE|nr:hypothetical protein PRZ48_007622 [Zasmidium cellare]